MAVKYLLAVVWYLIMCKEVHCQCSVIKTFVSTVERSIFCTQRGLLVSGKMHRIPDEQITASSHWAPRHEPYRVRLFNTVDVGAWAAKENSPGQWIQFDFGKPMTIMAIVTQGRHDTERTEWVETYRVQYATSDQQYTAGSWEVALYKPAPEIAMTDPTVFPGNQDRDTIKVNFLNEAIEARYIRIYPLTFNGHKSFRADLIGCFANKYDWQQCKTDLLCG